MEGTAFGRYRLLQLLGRGGMGEVWRAHDTATDRVVAVKVLPAHLAEDVQYQQRFRREAHAAARLNSPHVVPIHNYGEIDGRLYVDMRLIEGRDLQTVLADGPLDPARAVRIIEQVAWALNAAHKVGLVHRDVKPSNVLLDEDGFAYLIDFGIARAADETKLTGTGSMVGTLQYVAPERLGTGEVDARADIYALACVLYECLTGIPPFVGDSMERLVAAHLNTPPPRPSAMRPSVPGGFDGVIATGMAKDPDQRYATTVELASAAHDAITTPIPRPAATHVPEQLTQRAPASVTQPTMPSTIPTQRSRDDRIAVATQRAPGNGSEQSGASWIRRIGAALIDVIPILILYATALAVLTATEKHFCGTAVCSVKPSNIGTAAVWIAASLTLAYSIWNWGYWQGRNGSTIGMSVLRLNVIRDETGRLAGFGGWQRLAKIVAATLIIVAVLYVGWWQLSPYGLDELIFS